MDDAPATVLPGSPGPPRGDHTKPPPLPGSAARPWSLDDGELLSLDDESVIPDTSIPEPFRIPACIASDSAGTLHGPCAVVVVPHGIFLEEVRLQPFLYVPVGTTVQSSAGNRLQLALDEERVVSLEVTSRNARALVGELALFLSGSRGAPTAGEFRGGRWPSFAFVATVLAAVIGIGVFAWNSRPAPDVQNPETAAPAEASPKQPVVIIPEPGSSMRLPPTAMDQARADGVFRFDDGPDEVAALASNAETLVVGYRNGVLRIWQHEQPAFDPFLIGPKCDGEPARIEFDSSGSIVYAVCSGGAVAAPWNNPPDWPLKLPADRIAFRASPKGDLFAAARGNTLLIRYVPTALVMKPPSRAAKGFPASLPKEETVPLGVKAALAFPRQRPTFLAWHPAGMLVAGQPDGSILSWGSGGPGFTVVSRDHPTAVRVWAACHGTGVLATGDDRGFVGYWPHWEAKPRVFQVSRTAIVQLAFSPSGAYLAVADAAGGILILDPLQCRLIAKVTRPAPVKALAFGPGDDLIVISSGHAVEMWWVPTAMNESR